MKKLFLLLGAFVLLCSQMPDKTMLKGHLEGLGAEDSVLVFCNASKDTLAAAGGNFTYEFKGKVPSIVRIYNYPRQLGNGRMEGLRMNPVSLLMFPGQSLSLDGSFDKYTITGSAFYDEYNKVMDYISVEDSIRLGINEQYMELMRAKAPREQVRAKFEELKKADENMHALLKKYVSGHLDSEVSLFVLYKFRPRFGEQILPQLTDRVRNGELKEFYELLNEHYEDMAARRKASEKIKKGLPAPDFTLKDIDGRDFTLSSLRGKYVVLDFWGSWCGWCVKGFPKMKQMYKKYAGRLEIVGVDCRDTEDKWKEAVKRNGMTWTNVINSTEKTRDLTTIYNVPGFPTKIIISPEGEILKIVVGEKDEFYEAIDLIMKK